MSHQSSSIASILFVDDEPSILSALKRLFRPEGYEIFTAESGILGLEVMKVNQIDVVVSDMRMPEMSGAAFLEKIKDEWPNTIRILLTGYADINSTISAINKGEIHKYISKPIDDQAMLIAVREAVDRARLQAENIRLWALTNQKNEELRTLNDVLEARVAARTHEIEQVNAMLERSFEQLNENYLISIQVFSRLLELRGGIHVGHSHKVASLARRMAKQLGFNTKDIEDIYIAGLLQNIGMIGFPDSLYKKSMNKMDGEELRRFKRHPIDAENILLPIQQLSKIAKYIRGQHERLDGNGFPDGLRNDQISKFSQIIGLADDYISLLHGDLSDIPHTPESALRVIRQGANTRYFQEIVSAFEAALIMPDESAVEDQEITVPELRPGMVLSRDLLSPKGTLLLAAGFVFNGRVISQLNEMSDRDALRIKLYVRFEL